MHFTEKLPRKGHRRLETQREMLEEESEDCGDTKVGWVGFFQLFCSIFHEIYFHPRGIHVMHELKLITLN
jgi:hypothetical protein